MAFQPSPFQQAIFNWVSNGTGSAVVEAVAGSGKTTTIEHSLPFIPEHKSVHLFAFNTPIAKELNARIEKLRVQAQKDGTGREYRNVRASTFHSKGFGAIIKKLGKRGDEMGVDGSKMVKLARENLGERDLSTYGEFVSKLVGYAKGQGIGAITPDTDDAWYSLIQHHDLFLDDADATEARAIELARSLLDASNKAALTGYIDFDDQLYLPLLWRVRFWPNDWVFVDEGQDTNPVRRAFAKLSLKPGGRLVAVGDRRQAIYGFTGASHDALDIIKHEFNAIELPLTVSYRCAKNIVAQAQTVVSHIQAHDAAPDGVVEELELGQALKVLDAHDAVLCRNTAPLIKLAFHLIGQGRGCVVLGREIGTQLVGLVKKMKAKDIDTLEARLEAYRERETSKFMGRGEESKAEQVNDRVACITTIIESLEEGKRAISFLLQVIDGLFSDTNGVLTLSTIHKSKGREWRRVGILSPELMPSKWARQDWQMVQERNLQYVAYTRAIEHLMFLLPDRKEGMK